MLTYLLIVLVRFIRLQDFEVMFFYIQISDAKIMITETKGGGKETLIIISGTPEQTHAAQSLIQAFVISETETR